MSVNSDKTHLIVMTTEQYRRRHPTTVSIATEDGMMEATPVERLLGAFIHQDMKWTEYVRNNDNSLLHCLNQRLGALKKVSKTASFKASLNDFHDCSLVWMSRVFDRCSPSLPKQSCPSYNQAKHFHPNPTTFEGVWLAIGKKRANLPQCTSSPQETLNKGPSVPVGQAG